MRYLATIFLQAIIFGTLTLPAQAREVKTLAIGSPAPDFKLPGVDDRTYSLADFADAKVLMVLFTCNHCPTAQAYEPRVKKLYEDFKDKGLALVAISPNDPLAVRLDELRFSDLGDTLEDMKIRAKDQEFKFPYLYDGETQETSAAYGAMATPHVFLFDAKRTLQYVGRIDDSEVKKPTAHDARNAIENLLEGEPVKVQKTRVFGCSTKWSDKREFAVNSVKKWDKEKVELTTIQPDALKKRLTQKSENHRLVNVWATWCTPCVDELEELVTIHRMYRTRKFEVITVSADEVENARGAEEILAKKHCSATNYLLDAKSRDELFDAVDPQWQGAVPYTVLIDPDGKVIHRIHDRFDPMKLKRVIADSIGRTYASK